MGMLIEGRWHDTDAVMANGAYVRPPSPIRSARQPDVADALARRPGRFVLIASASCPWSHRATLVRALKRLDDRLALHVAHGPRIEGYPMDGGRSWRVPGTDRQIRNLHELYTLHDRRFTGRATVPVLWDAAAATIVSNDSADIQRTLDAVAVDRPDDFTLVPADLARRIEAMNRRLHGGLNNAVYRAGFAGTQSAYEAAVADVFATMARLERRLSDRRYLLGPVLTESDLRLLPTLLRFDAIYYILFRCSRRRLVDYPGLWAYARDVAAWRGIAATVDFATMRTASYRADSRGGPPIVAVPPEADWTEPHGRDRLGPALVAGRDGRRRAVDPRTLAPLEEVAA